MGFDEGRIILDSENGAYYAGQTVYGRLVFDQNKVKTIHGIYVDMKGFCKVHWTTQRSRRVNDRTQHYTVNHDSYEEYFRKKTFVFGDASGERHLQPGQHEFRFDFHIPASSPSSFEGSHGHVRYRIKAVMLVTGFFSSNKEKMAVVRVFAPLDLNQNPYCKEPIEYELLKSYCCCCISYGSSEVLVKLPVGGYCPGQVIPMEVSCKNPSSVEIEEIKFAIKKDVIYTATSEAGTRTEHDTVAEITKGPVPARTTRNWTVEMDVPALDLYNLNSCQYITINYSFKVSTEAEGCHSGTDETRPIVFGTIPLVGFQDNVQNPLHDQMPQINVQNVQGAQSYLPPPIMNQPLPNAPYTSGNMPYANTSPYPGNTPYPTTPNLGRNSPYPNVSPYPPNPPYPAGNAPYPTNTPYSTDNGFNSNPPPYPGLGPNTTSPFPSVTESTPLKTGTLGFVGAPGNEAKAPLLPPGANVPYSPPNPYTIASAPQPPTPGNDFKKSPLEDTPELTSSSPAYNPDFMNDKKDDKTN